MLHTSGQGGLWPEQVWATAPAGPLVPGCPAGSAMPQVWARAEYLKLLWAREHGRPHGQVEAVLARYGGSGPAPATQSWTTGAPVFRPRPGAALTVPGTQPFTLRRGGGPRERWTDVLEWQATPTEFGPYRAEFTAAELDGRDALTITRRCRDTWEATNHRVELTPAPPSPV